ncbi:helicase-related protein [Methanogenium cariaci]
MFGETYADVFFEKSMEKLTLPVSDLMVRDTPDAAFSAGRFVSADQFLLRLLHDQITAASTQGLIQSAANFKIIPLPHQILAVNFVLDQFKPRALIADEVGLGKTIEAALIFEELKARNIAKRALIVAPSSLCLQWQDEMKSKFGEDFAIYDRDTIKTLQQLHGQETNIWKLTDTIITSIDYLKPRNMNEELGERTNENRMRHNTSVYEAAVHVGFDVVIIDEAHKLTKDESGNETARYRLGKALAEATPFMLLLSATPHQGDTAKFRNLLTLIDPYQFYKECDITPDNVRSVTVRNNKRAVVDFKGNRIFKHRLTSLKIINWDEKDDKIETELYESITDYVSHFYDLAVREQNRTMMFLLLIYQRMASSSSRSIYTALSKRLNILEDTHTESCETLQTNIEFIDDIEEHNPEHQLAELSQSAVCKTVFRENSAIELEISMLRNCVSLAKRAMTGRNDAKFRKLLDILDEFKIRENEPTLKFIIFTEFVETQNYLNENLQNLGYTTALINGGLSLEEKTKEKLNFQNSAQILISTDAGGEGINLQFCRIMINYDLPWNPMRLEQRIGRIDRIGQDHDVKIVNFLIGETVEQRVREVIETKLEKVKSEFNDGEDKLADILSTLEDEFSFEKIYIDAVRKRKFEAQDLDAIAEEIYNRAKEIIASGDLTLPYSNLDESLGISEHDLCQQGHWVRRLIESYLTIQNKELTEYKKKNQVYYFEDPKSRKKISNVIFDQNLSLENEEYELFSFAHPYIKGIISELDSSLDDSKASKLVIDESKFSGQKGYLFNYTLTITNNLDPEKRYIIPIFMDTKGKFNSRISHYFSDASHIQAHTLVSNVIPLNLQSFPEVVQSSANQNAESIFYEYKVTLENNLKKREEKMQQYFLDKETSIRRIAVPNIRDSKLRELSHDKFRQENLNLQKRQLVPGVACNQIAYVEFQ